MKNKLNVEDQIKRDAMLVVEFLNATTPKWKPTLKENLEFIIDTIAEVKDQIKEDQEFPLEYIEKIDEANSLIKEVLEGVLPPILLNKKESL